MKITKYNPIYGNDITRDIPVNPEDYMAWKNDYGSIEDLMPYLNQADKDFILSGLLPGQWNKIASFEDFLERV